MYAGVPTTAPVCVRWSPSACSRASPKSRIFTRGPGAGGRGPGVGAWAAAGPRRGGPGWGGPRGGGGGGGGGAGGRSVGIGSRRPGPCSPAPGPRPPLLQPDVARLDIPVDEPAVVGGGQAVGDL